MPAPWVIEALDIVEYVGPGVISGVVCLAGRAVEPGMEAGTRYLKSIAQPADRLDMPVLRDEGELHVDALAKNAAAFV